MYRKGELMKDGLILMYVKDGVIYPVAMSNDEYDMLQIVGSAIFEDKKINIINKPQGTAVNLKN